MTLTIAYCWAGKHYKRLADVLGRSIVSTCPGAMVLSREMPLMDAKGRMATHVHGHMKLEYWAEVVNGRDGNVALLDADTLVLGDLGEAFADDFDVACTVRSGPQRVNSGVAFVRANDRSRRFMQKWVEINGELLKSGDALRGGYSGLNERAFDEARAARLDVRVAELPCEVWNQTDREWRHFAPFKTTKIVHIKGPLRELCLKHDDVSGVARAWQCWKGFEQ